MALTEQQKDEREQALGSSDAPTVCGISKYSSPLELFYKLTGQLPRYDKTEKLHQKLGSRLEPIIAEIAAEEIGIKIRRIPVRVHPIHAFMISHADFEIVSNPKGPGLMEVKNRSGERPWEHVPDDVAIQVAHQLAVTNREWATVAALFQFGQLETYEVKRDRELEEYLIEIEAKFIARVQKGEAPTEAWTPDNIGILKRLYPTDSGKTIQLRDEDLGHIAGFLAAKEAEEHAKAAKATHEGHLKNWIQTATYAEGQGYRISWKSTKSSEKFDEDAFAKQHPDLYQQFMKTVPGHRRFMVKPSKEISK